MRSVPDPMSNTINELDNCSGGKRKCAIFIRWYRSQKRYETLDAHLYGHFSYSTPVNFSASSRLRQDYNNDYDVLKVFMYWQEWVSWSGHWKSLTMESRKEMKRSLNSSWKTPQTPSSETRTKRRSTSSTSKTVSSKHGTAGEITSTYLKLFICVYLVWERI